MANNTQALKHSDKNAILLHWNDLSIINLSQVIGVHTMQTQRLK